MKPGSLVRIADSPIDGMWVSLPDGESEWIPAPFLPAVYVGPGASRSRISARSEILYGGRLLVVWSGILEAVCQ